MTQTWPCVLLINGILSIKHNINQNIIFIKILIKILINIIDNTNNIKFKLFIIIQARLVVGAAGIGVSIYRCSRNRKAASPPRDNRHLIDPLKHDETVKIIGLKTYTSLNEKEGKIVQYDQSKNRYQVKLNGNTSVNVNPENL